MVVFVSLLFVCGSSGVVAVSSRSGRRLSAGAVRAAGLRAVSRVGGVWLPVWRVRASLASLRGVLRGRRLSVASRAWRVSCARFGGSLARSPFVAVRPVRGFGRWLSLRGLSLCARAGGSLLASAFPVRAVPSWRALVCAGWRWLPPRVAGRVGCVRRGRLLLAWVLCSFGLALPSWRVVAVPPGLAPVLVLRRPSGGSGAPSVFSASGGGSVLWCSSPAVVAAVRSGACPLSLALRVFRWPVRSAVLWSLWACLSSPRFASLGVPRGLVADLVRACLASLGWRFSAVRSVRGLCRGAFRGFSVGAFLASRSCSVVLPSVPLSWAVSASFSASAVVSALRSVVRCLGWLGSRSSGGAFCPPALRGVVASVARAGLRALGC